MTLLVNILATGLIVAIIWWFWIAKPAAQRINDEVINILVDQGVYTPANIVITRGKPVRLIFTRRDASPCSEQVVFEGLDMTLSLPLGKPEELLLSDLKAGEYRFHCQMNMYQGNLIVK